MWCDLPELDNYVVCPGTWCQCPVSGSPGLWGKMGPNSQLTSLTWLSQTLQGGTRSSKNNCNCILASLICSLLKELSPVQEDIFRSIHEILKCVLMRLLLFNKFLTFYWVKPKWNKMENLYPVLSKSRPGEGSQEKQNKNSPHFVVCMKICLVGVCRWINNNQV